MPLIAIFLLRLVFCWAQLDDVWHNIEMPLQSHFAGFEPPSDEARWSKARQLAAAGRQVLLSRLLRTIHSPGDLLSGDKKFKWVQRLTDVFVSRETGFETPLRNYTGYRAPIVMIGYKLFDRKHHEGNEIKTMSYHPRHLLSALRKGQERFPRKFVAIGNMDENWSWCGTAITNRTASWSFTFSRKLGPFRADQLKEIRPFLDNPNVIMLVVNQHHNISHPKVISIPRGVLPDVAKVIWDEAQRALRLDTKKKILAYVASSSWGTRPEIIACVNRNMQGHLLAERKKIGLRRFMNRLSTSYAVLAVPGLGYDTFRLWETLASGSMPVLERGVGLDRTLYRLPALLVDDFADVTPALIRQAYVEAVYRADSWDYRRITARYWERLIFRVSETGSLSTMLKLHPMTAEDAHFTRPMVPFDCKGLGGCGLGTRRVPSKSCAVNFETNFTMYNWWWDQFLQWPEGYPIPGHHYYGKVDPIEFVGSSPVDD